MVDVAPSPNFQRDVVCEVLVLLKEMVLDKHWVPEKLKDAASVSKYMYDGLTRLSIQP